MVLQHTARRAGLVSAGTLALVFSGAGLAFASTSTLPVPTPTSSTVNGVITTVTGLVSPSPTPTTSAVPTPTSTPSPVSSITNTVTGLLPGTTTTTPTPTPGTGGGGGGGLTGNRDGGSGPAQPVQQLGSGHAPRQALDAAGAANESVYGYLTHVTMPDLGSFNAAALPPAGVAPQVAPGQPAPEVAGAARAAALGLAGSHSPAGLPAVLIVLAVATVGAAAAAHLGVIQQRLAATGTHAAG